MRHFDRCGIGSNLLELLHVAAGALNEIESDFDERHHLPIVGKRGIESAEGVSDSSPFLNRRVVRVPAMNDVPDEAANNTNATRHSRYRSPSI